MIDILSWSKTNADYHLSIIMMPDLSLETEIATLPSFFEKIFRKMHEKIAKALFFPHSISECDLFLCFDTIEFSLDREAYHMLSDHIATLLSQLEFFFINDCINLTTFRITIELPNINFIADESSNIALSSSIASFLHQISSKSLSHLELRFRSIAHEDRILTEAIIDIANKRHYQHLEIHLLKKESEYSCKRIDNQTEQSLESRIVLLVPSVYSLHIIESDWTTFMLYQGYPYGTSLSSIKTEFFIKGNNLHGISLPHAQTNSHDLLKMTLQSLSQSYWRWIRSHITQKISSFYSVWRVSGREVRAALNDNPTYLRDAVDCVLALPARSMHHFMWKTSQIMRHYEPKDETHETLTDYNIDLALLRFFSNITSSLVSVGINLLGESPYLTIRECVTLLHQKAPYINHLGIKIDDSFKDCNEIDFIKSKYTALKHISKLRFLQSLSVFYHGHKYVVSPSYHTYQGEGWQKTLKKWNRLPHLKELMIHAHLYQNLTSKERICSRSMRLDPIEIFCESFSKTKIPVLSLDIKSMDFDGQYHLGPKIFYKNNKKMASRIAKNPYVYSLTIPRNSFATDPIPPHIGQLSIDIAHTTKKNFFFRDSLRSLLKCLSFERPNIDYLQSVLTRHAQKARQYALEYSMLCFHYFRLYYTPLWPKLAHYVLAHSTYSQKTVLESPIQYHLAKPYRKITSVAEWLDEDDCARLLFASEREAKSAYSGRQSLGNPDKKYRLRTYNS